MSNGPNISGRKTKRNARLIDNGIASYKSPLGLPNSNSVELAWCNVCGHKAWVDGAYYCPISCVLDGELVKCSEVP